MTEVPLSGQGENREPPAQQGASHARGSRDVQQAHDADVRKSPATRMSPRGKRSPAKWAMAILVGIGLSALAIVLAGVHIGARGQGRWYTEAVLWAAKLLQ